MPRDLTPFWVYPHAQIHLLFSIRLRWSLTRWRDHSRECNLVLVGLNAYTGHLLTYFVWVVGQSYLPKVSSFLFSTASFCCLGWPFQRTSWSYRSSLSFTSCSFYSYPKRHRSLPLTIQWEEPHSPRSTWQDWLSASSLFVPACPELALSHRTALSNQRFHTNLEKSLHQDWFLGSKMELQVVKLNLSQAINSQYFGADLWSRYALYLSLWRAMPFAHREPDTWRHPLPSCQQFYCSNSNQCCRHR